jgi:hypothetical protein
VVPARLTDFLKLYVVRLRKKRETRQRVTYPDQLIIYGKTSRVPCRVLCRLQVVAVVEGQRLVSLWSCCGTTASFPKWRFISNSPLAA